jgi:hypothetical protein
MTEPRVIYNDNGVLAELDDDGVLWLSTGIDEDGVMVLLTPGQRIALAKALLEADIEETP